VTEVGKGCIFAKCYKLNLNWQEKEHARQEGQHEKCYTVVETSKFREKGWWF